MADQSPIPIPLAGEVPFLPQTAEQAAERDAMQSSAARAAIVGEPVSIPVPPPAAQMSVGSPAADDALVAALETAHAFISRVTGWKGEPDEKQDVLELTAAALQTIVAPAAPDR